MNIENAVKGYKVFNPDWTCRGKKYTCPGKFEEEVKLELCASGMHFCKKAVDCFNYYEFNPNNHVAEVVARGLVIEEGDKCCTDKLEIIREIPWAEVLEIVNTGSSNSGDRNSGDRNSGNWNSGNWNSGNWNSGDWNSGNWNSGDWNSCNYSNGCFNTKTPKIYLFNRPSEWTYYDWIASPAHRLLSGILFKKLIWVSTNEMSGEEKEAHPEAKTTGGYPKKQNLTEFAVAWWRTLSEDDKSMIKSIPNFDPGIFKEITGIDVENN